MAIIGRQFIACWKMEENPSPRGTTDSTKIIADICSRQIHANRPYGTIFFSSSLQAINCLPTISSPHGLKMWVMISSQGGDEGEVFYTIKIAPVLLSY